MPSEQQMMQGTMLQPGTMMNAQYQDSVQLREFQPLNTSTIMGVQFMYYNRKFKMEEKQGSGKIEQG